MTLYRLKLSLLIMEFFPTLVPNFAAIISEIELHYINIYNIIFQPSHMAYIYIRDMDFWLNHRRDAKTTFTKSRKDIIMIRLGRDEPVKTERNGGPQ